MPNAHIKKMFPGAVTAQGFYSFYNYMIQQDANHIFVLKGGPGVGKSTFMKKIGQTMVDRGYDIEYHCCSSDNGSIDGVVIPQLKIGILDGTAPHVVDPKNPGAVDEIVNLGEYWDEAMIKQSRKEIIACNLKVTGYFQRAYFALQEAKVALDEWEFYTKAYQNWAKINEMTLRIEAEIFTMAPKDKGQERHLFAWGHTPQGKTEFIDTLLNDTDTLYMLVGQPGIGKSTFIARIAERAAAYGLDVQYYHSTLDPAKLDLIILPELQKAFVINSEPYAYTPKFVGEMITLDFEENLNMAQLMKECGDEIGDCQIRVNQHITRARKASEKAKATHDLMEMYYVPAMNFSELDKKMDSILQRILVYTEESAIAAMTTIVP
ncbi:MAG TPA: PRK06851 family protein [Desulfosporosinus sp.]|nr:PRK06851 family protein [Desulfosporosinus sp.]